jgi:hypothetical protein
MRLHGQRHIATIIHNEGRSDIVSRLSQLRRLTIKISPRRGLIPILKKYGPTSGRFLQRLNEREPPHDVRIKNDVETG